MSLLIQTIGLPTLRLSVLIGDCSPCSHGMGFAVHFPPEQRQIKTLQGLRAHAFGGALSCPFPRLHSLGGVASHFPLLTCSIMEKGCPATLVPRSSELKRAPDLRETLGMCLLCLTSDSMLHLRILQLGTPGLEPESLLHVKQRPLPLSFGKQQALMGQLL